MASGSSFFVVGLLTIIDCRLVGTPRSTILFLSFTSAAESIRPTGGRSADDSASSRAASRKNRREGDITPPREKSRGMEFPAPPNDDAGDWKTTDQFVICQHRIIAEMPDSKRPIIHPYLQPRATDGPSSAGGGLRKTQRVAVTRITTDTRRATKSPTSASTGFRAACGRFRSPSFHRR